MLLHFINWTNCINCKVIFSIFYLVILFQFQLRVLLRVTQLQFVNLRIKRICYVMLCYVTFSMQFLGSNQGPSLQIICHCYVLVWERVLVSDKSLCMKLDSFDMWCLRKTLRTPYTRHVTYAEVRNTTWCEPLSDLERYMRCSILVI